jgi:hypothetical protein
MTYDEWVSTYKPVQNELVANAPYDGTMFETFGVEVSHVLNLSHSDPSRVWTLLDCDGIQYVSAGYHLVNRLGYFITAERFADTPDDVCVLDDDELPPRVELRKRISSAHAEWCVIYDGNVYPFGGDSFGLECAEREAERMESARDNNGFNPDPDFYYSGEDLSGTIV